LVLLAALASAGCNQIPFDCTHDSQCMLDGKSGWCEDNHHCSLPDDSGACPSGRRFAPLGTAEGCVPPAPACSVVGGTAGATSSCAWSSAGHVACWGEDAN